MELRRRAVSHTKRWLAGALSRGRPEMLLERLGSLPASCETSSELEEPWISSPELQDLRL